MTTLQKIHRADFVRQQRTPKSSLAKILQRTTRSTRKTFHQESAYYPDEKRLVSRRTSTKGSKIKKQKGYDIAFSLGRTNVHAPALNIPQFGSRWVSAGFTLILSFILFTLWTASPFTVKGAEVFGNQRIGTNEINAVLGMIGEPIIKAVPAKIAANLHTAYPDLASVKVIVGLPNRITIDVEERIPVLAWYQDGVVTWIDANGVAFTPRGEVPGLMQVSATGTPNKIPIDSTLPIYAQKFITPEMVEAMTELARDVPAGMPMTFDPVYGMGWEDPRGWSVYFGQDAKEISMKNNVYQAIVDTLILQGVQPSLISVEYLNAPFYK
jgi:cell division protein FtsQ